MLLAAAISTSTFDSFAEMCNPRNVPKEPHDFLDFLKTSFSFSNLQAGEMAGSYKSLKEDFVSNLTGGKISEINCVTAVAPVSSTNLSPKALLMPLCSQHSSSGLFYSQDSHSLRDKPRWCLLSTSYSMSEPYSLQ